MNRRDFLCSSGAASAALGFPLGKWTGRPFARSRAAGGWRTFDVTTHVAVLQPSGTTRIWVPAALVSETPYQKTLANTFDAAGGTAQLVERAADSLGIIAAAFPAGVTPVVTITTPIATRNYGVDLSAPPRPRSARPAALGHFSRPPNPPPPAGISK